MKREAFMKEYSHVRRFLWVLLVFLVLSACAPKAIIYYGAPSLVDGTRKEMNTPGFWIGRHPDPDAVIADEETIPLLNDSIRKATKAVYDISGYPAVRNGQAFRDAFRKTLIYVSSQGYVTPDGKKVSKDFMSSMEAAVDIGRIPSSIAVRWGLTVSYCDQRLLPASAPLFKGDSDKSIDRLQNNALDLATPVVILHESSDRKWLYVISPFSDGWVESRYVAFCSADELGRFEAQPSFVVATDAKADLYLDPLLRQHHSYLHMGVRLPMAREWGPGIIQVMIPYRADDGRCTFNAAYVSDAQVHRGYLPYTPRHAIEQAFKLLNSPYGWGGMYGEQDCSRFIQEVFATMGVMLPRNSTQQAKVGKLVASFGRTSTIAYRTGILSNSAGGGITLLQFPGHIMLFLGMADGRPYAIHDIFAYTEPSKDGDRLIAINRVAVTSLNIGGGTKKGSLLQRITRVRMVAPEFSRRL